MGASPGIDELLYKLATESGWVLLRVDKPGVGDSEGVCADTDLTTEIEGSRAALQWLRSHPWVDSARIVVVGHSFSGALLPIVADRVPAAGYIVLNSWVRTWMERLLEFERLQAEASGMAPGEVSDRQRKLAEFYALFLEQQKTPRQIIAERPDLAPVWNDAPEHQYGRSARFHHQLQRINAARAWSGVAVPTLAMWSEADLVMHRTDHERLVAMVNRNLAKAAELVVVPGADHALAVNRPSVKLHAASATPVRFETEGRALHDQIAAGQSRLALESDDEQALWQWLASQWAPVTSMVISRPDAERAQFVPVGAAVLPLDGVRASVLSYRIDGRPVTLVVANATEVPDRPAAGWWAKRVMHRRDPGGVNTLTWTVGGGTYVMVSELDDAGQRACLISHTAPRFRERILEITRR